MEVEQVESWEKARICCSGGSAGYSPEFVYPMVEKTLFASLCTRFRVPERGQVEGFVVY